MLDAELGLTAKDTTSHNQNLRRQRHDSGQWRSLLGDLRVLWLARNRWRNELEIMPGDCPDNGLLISALPNCGFVE